MEKKLPHITIVIPAYNEEKYLPRCLKALQKQWYPKEKFDIIVVDNNSTDKTSQIAKQYGAKVIKENQQGHVFSLNTGLKNARGDIIAVTDADSIVTPHWLHILAKKFDNPAVVGVTGSVRLDTESKAINIFFEQLSKAFLFIHFACHKPHTIGPNMAIRKSAFKKLKEVDTRYQIGGDVEIGMRLRKYGKVVFAHNLSVTTSSRRLKTDFPSFSRDMYKYSLSYIYSIWLERPPHTKLLPVR